MKREKKTDRVTENEWKSNQRLYVREKDEYWGYKISIRGLKKKIIRMGKKRNCNIKNLKCYFVYILWVK